MCLGWGRRERLLGEDARKTRPRATVIISLCKAGVPCSTLILAELLATCLNNCMQNSLEWWSSTLEALAPAGPLGILYNSCPSPCITESTSPCPPPTNQPTSCVIPHVWCTLSASLPASLLGINQHKNKAHYFSSPTSLFTSHICIWNSFQQPGLWTTLRSFSFLRASAFDE